MATKVKTKTARNRQDLTTRNLQKTRRDIEALRSETRALWRTFGRVLRQIAALNRRAVGNDGQSSVGVNPKRSGR